MKRNLLTMLAVVGIALGGIAVARSQGPGCPVGAGMAGAHGHGFMFEKLTETLSLTPDQQTKVQPIVDQAKPQLQAIHQDAMQKAKAVIDTATAQIRPLLTPEQQTKLDSIQKAHQDMMNAAKELHDAKSK